jgi:hypothetical protein
MVTAMSLGFILFIFLILYTFFFLYYFFFQVLFLEKKQNYIRDERGNYLCSLIVVSILKSFCFEKLVYVLGFKLFIRILLQF